ncbi:winged helix-turn-helix transcriptional regulator (plasmid) [Agrobacterium sp. rho-13.3]|uniref:winged helix-turn-helix transcriptional regulator n=1 Tax=Agrobacterium sp. rho-13.3 TaxID=3072980 RepID=UPI002A179F99|nr:helix-turn-helix domain-containing protein [Agrobacterium sp. rho-13.3]MDX8310180.1 helix-turn-helix domain-containing protein [Agrobacterium sp. rho-13.3]
MPKTPPSKKPAKGSNAGAPVTAAFDLLGRRWTMRILWELSQHGPCTFRDLQERCGQISPTSVNTRLKEMRNAGIVEQEDGSGYSLTALGKELNTSLEPLREWANRWNN